MKCLRVDPLETSFLLIGCNRGFPIAAMLLSFYAQRTNRVTPVLGSGLLPHCRERRKRERTDTALAFWASCRPPAS